MKKQKELNNGFSGKTKYCFFKENNIVQVDYKDVKLLKRFTNDNGKIMPRRVTGTSAKMHRKVVSAIKRPILEHTYRINSELFYVFVENACQILRESLPINVFLEI